MHQKTHVSVCERVRVSVCLSMCVSVCIMLYDGIMMNVTSYRV